MYSGRFGAINSDAFEDLFAEASEAFDEFLATTEFHGAVELQTAALDAAQFQTDLKVRHGTQRLANQGFVLADQIAAQEVEDLGNEIIEYAATYNLPGVTEHVNQFRQAVQAAEIAGFTGS